MDEETKVQLIVSTVLSVSLLAAYVTLEVTGNGGHWWLLFLVLLAW